MPTPQPKSAGSSLAIGSILIFAVSLIPSVCLAQSYRENLFVPTPVISKKLLLFAQSEDFRKIEKTLQFVVPLMNTLEIKFDADLKNPLKLSLANIDSPGTIHAIQQFILLDLRDLLDLARLSIKDSPATAKSYIKTAYLQYLNLSPFIKASVLRDDQEIVDDFRAVTLLVILTDPPPEKIKNNLQAIEDKITATMSRIN